MCWFSVCWFSVWPPVNLSVGVGKVTCVLIQGQRSSIVSFHIFSIHFCLSSAVFGQSGGLLLKPCNTSQLMNLNMSQKCQILPEHGSFKTIFYCKRVLSQILQHCELTPNWLPTGKLPYKLQSRDVVNALQAPQILLNKFHSSGVLLALNIFKMEIRF